MIGKWSWFAAALGGARWEVLNRCPTERIKFEILAWLLIIASANAVVSMWLALAAGFGFNGILAVFPAAGWGLAILGINRFLLTLMLLEDRRRLRFAAPRLLASALLEFLISNSIVLGVFQGQVSALIGASHQSGVLTSWSGSRLSII